MDHLERIEDAKEGRSIWAVSCNLSAPDIYGVEDDFKEMFDSTEGDIVLNLDQVQVLDSRGVGALLMLARKLGKRDSKLIMRHPRPQVNSVLELTSMNRLAIVEE